jgi:hypothetical protein
MNFKIVINPQEVLQKLDNIKDNAMGMVQKAVKSLADSTHEKIGDLAGSKLKTTADKYKKSIKSHEISPNTYVIELLPEMTWRETGMIPHSMVQDLLKGRQYRVIPFSKDSDPSTMSPKSKEMVDLLRSELKRATNSITNKKGIPFKKLEFDESGKPLTGLLHKLDIKSPKPTLNAKTPALQGVRIYQHENRETKKVTRSIVTFRTVSQKHALDGRWFYPGLEGAHIFDEAYKWALDKWEHDLLPELLEVIKK